MHFHCCLLQVGGESAWLPRIQMTILHKKNTKREPPLESGGSLLKSNKRVKIRTVPDIPPGTNPET